MTCLQRRKLVCRRAWLKIQQSPGTQPQKKCLIRRFFSYIDYFLGFFFFFFFAHLVSTIYFPKWCPKKLLSYIIIFWYLWSVCTVICSGKKVIDFLPIFTPLALNINYLLFLVKANVVSLLVNTSIPEHTTAGGCVTTLVSIYRLY